MDFFKFANAADTLFVTDVNKQYLWLSLVIGAACFITVYIFQTIALFTIAKREGFKYRWMALVPFFNTYYIGVLAEKNRVFRAKAKHLSLAAAIIEAVCAALYILYFVALSYVFKGGYANPETVDYNLGQGYVMSVVTGYTVNIEAMPDGLAWAGWVFCYLQKYVIYWLDLAYTLLNVFILIAFFRTYACRRYMLFALLSVLFPLQGVFMFAVRNNRGRNYMEFVREEQQRRYQMYQEYMRTHGGDGYGGYQQRPPQGGYNQQPPVQSAPEDPFGGLGANSNEGKDDDPFNGL